MTNLDFKFSRRDLNFLVKLKARQFQGQNDSNITEKQIKDYLFKMKWKKLSSMPLCEIVDDIMGLEYSDVFNYLSVEVIKEASNLSIQDFSELISK